jgi:hypothetical protein
MIMPNINATVVGGSVRLDSYPNLVYAPQQWGDHIACHSNGADVYEIAEAVSNLKSGQTLRDVVTSFGVSLAEVTDAVQYVSDWPDPERRPK